MAKGYWVSAYHKITNQDKFAAYAKIAGAVIPKAGGKFVVRGMPAAVHEKGFNQRIVIVEWESVEKAKAAHDGCGAPPPVVAAGVLEPSLRGRVVVERRLAGRARRHLLLEATEPLLELDQMSASREDVLAQAQAPFARRALVVKRDPGALLERQLARVDGRLAREHAQQRRLARAVSPRQREPVPPLDLEGDVAQKGIARHVLPEPGCDRHSHGTDCDAAVTFGCGAVTRRS